jgi:hypothetical protein
VLNTARVEPGSCVAVFGCGGVGQSTIQGARIAGASGAKASLKYSSSKGSSSIRQRSSVHRFVSDPNSRVAGVGSVRIALPGSDQRAVLHINNSGERSPAATVPGLFELFFRLDESRSRDSGGVLWSA